MFPAFDTSKTIRLMTLAGLAAVAFPLSAAGQLTPACSATITSPIVFSGFDVLSGSAVDTTATLNISCSGVLSTVTVSVCPSIEAGSGGQTGGVRQMQRIGGSEKLSFGLFRDAARTIPWGSINDPSLGEPPLITLSVPLLGTGNASRTIYARLFGGQSGIAAGTYQSDFSGAQTDVSYGVTTSLTGCTGGLLGLLTESTTAPFAVETSVEENCLLDVTQNVDFGIAGVLSGNVDAAGQLQVTCTSGTDYAVSLERQAGPQPLGAWEMTNGAETITYGLYADIARTDLWGGPPADDVSLTGTGAAQLLGVYGRVPPQTTPPAGTYTDTVIVTVTY